MIWKRTLTVIAIFLITAGLTSLASRSEKIAPNKAFGEFPLEIGQWNASRGQLDPKVYNILGVEDYILADYRKNTGEVVNLYVGFYQSQKEGDIIHSPKNCMPGAGWNITQSSVIPVSLTDEGKTIHVIRLLLAKRDERQVVLYWFQSRGRIISSEYMQKIWLVVDSIFKHRTDGSFVRLISPVIKDEQATLKTLKDFTRLVFPYLEEHIPR